MSTLQYMREIFKERIQSFQQEGKKPGEAEPYAGLQKSAVVQESRCFNDSQINDRKCRQILTKLIYLINQGNEFTDIEGQNLFFSITKLFQSGNSELRRMIYVIIKEFRDEQSQYIVISSLTKDINSKNDLFRMNALRTISLVLEASNLVQIERYIKTCIIDKNQAISTAALLAGVQIYKMSPEIVRKWASEVQDRLQSKYPQNHFHAVILLHEIKKNDKNTFIKVLYQLTKENLVPLATLQIIRFIREVAQESDPAMFLDYLMRQVHKSQEMVIFEACKTLCEIKSLSNKDLQPMISVLTVFLGSSNSINKFVALKLLNKLITNPIRRSLLANTAEIESLIHDSNKSLSSLAVSILLKVCKEENIDKLLNQIYDYLSDMSDEFKIDILRSVSSLVTHKKWKPILQFLTSTLKCEASPEFKKFGVDIIEKLLVDIPESQELALLGLAEYIEDCPHQTLQLHVLSILNREANKKNCPDKVIRFVNNRIHLEEAEIRAAAVGVIGKFKETHPQVEELLRLARVDPDEEVRNRSEYYLRDKVERFVPIELDDLDALEAYLTNNLQAIQSSEDSDVLSMEKAREYAEKNKGKVKKTQPVTLLEEDKKEAMEEEEDEEHDMLEDNFDKYRKLFRENKVFSSYGELRKISKAIEISDQKAEYVVTVTKYLFEGHIVCEFKIRNTLNNIILTDVHMELNIKNNDQLQVVTIIPATQIDFDSSANSLIGLQINPDIKMVQTQIECVMNFTVKEINLSTEKVITQYQDDYQLEDFGIYYRDFLVAEDVKNKFQIEWEQFNVLEQQATYQLEYKNIDVAIKEIIKHFGLCVCDNSDRIQQQNKYHTLMLSGRYLQVARVLVICMIGFDQKLGCILKVRVKSDDELLTNNILETFA